MKKNKVLISVPGLHARGGITGYFYTIKKYFNKNIIYITRGARKWPQKYPKIIELMRMVYDVFMFIVYMIIFPKVGIVQLNTSLGKSGIQRDMVFQFIARFFKKKIIVFFHGWNPEFEKIIISNKSHLFYRYLSKIDLILTLSNNSKNKLIKWGFNREIIITTTIVDDELIKNWQIKEIHDKFVTSNRINFLYLARIEKEKGIYEAIDTFKILLASKLNITFNIAGDGLELENVKEYVKEKDIKGIKFYGFVDGDKKKQLLQESHIFLFPSYTEGMPTAVLEAMAMGLIIVTRPVGGLIDFFTNKNGLIIDSFNPQEFARNIMKLLNEDFVKIAIYNYEFAKNRFYASQVAQKQIEIYNKLIENINETINTTT